MIKKNLIFAIATLLCVALAVPASAFENEFGGYWRTRFFLQKDFSGSVDSSLDEKNNLSRADTRTRINYTAKINDSLKLVNEFEMDAVWGEGDATADSSSGAVDTNNSYGDIGTDGVAFEIKNTYADFNLGPVLNVKMGAQPGVIARGFLFDEDFTGITATINSSSISIPVIWIKEAEGGMGFEKNSADVDYVIITPTFNVGDSLSVNPYVAYDPNPNLKYFPNQVDDEKSMYYFGADLDASLGIASLWLTGIYQWGWVENNTHEYDYNAYLLALGGAIDVAGLCDVHGEWFFVTGDDTSTFSEREEFEGLRGQSYYWAEIMGLGKFDTQAYAASPGDQLSNITAFNIGVGTSFDVLAKTLTMNVDIWTAQLEETNASGDDRLGTEIDVNIGVDLFEDLTLEIIGAYMLVGDKSTIPATEEKNPYEAGTRLMLKF